MNRVKTLCWQLLVAFSLLFVSCSDGKKNPGTGIAAANRVMRERVELPSGKERVHTQPMARITINSNLEYYAQWGEEQARRIDETELVTFLAECSAKDSDMFVALYADEDIPYSEVVKVLNVANENKCKMVLATRRPDASDK